MTFKEHNNRDIAKKHAEYITGEELRIYVATKVAQYVGENPTVFDGACGSGQLCQFVKPSFLYGVDIQEASVKTCKENFPNSDLECNSFFKYKKDIQADCVIMNPPFSLKFKDFSEEERNLIQEEFPWKKSGNVDDIFILKSLNFTKRYAFHIAYPGVTYRANEKKFREILGDKLIEYNTIENAFDDTNISVAFFVIDKEADGTQELHKELYDCKTKKFKVVEKTTDKEEWWTTPREEVEREEIDIDSINDDLDKFVLGRLDYHLNMMVFLNDELNENRDVQGFLNKAYKILDKYNSLAIGGSDG